MYVKIYIEWINDLHVKNNLLKNIFIAAKDTFNFLINQKDGYTL